MTAAAPSMKAAAPDCVTEGAGAIRCSVVNWLAFLTRTDFTTASPSGTKPKSSGDATWIQLVTPVPPRSTVTGELPGPPPSVKDAPAVPGSLGWKATLRVAD